LSRDLILVAVSLIAWGVGEGMFFFFQSLYLQELGADPLKIGGILGGVGLAMTISYLPAGLLSDRIGRRPLIHSAWIVATCATALMAFAKTLPIFTAGMILYGLTGFVTVPLNSYITAARGKLSVGRTLTLISASFNLGSILGPLLGGWVASQAGLQTNFRLAMVIFVLSTGIILFIRPQPVEAPTTNGARSSLGFILNRRYLRYTVLMFVVMFGLYISQPLTTNFLQNERGVNLLQMGQLISARSVGIVLLSLTLGQMNARVGFLAAQAGMALFNLLIWLGTGFPFYLAGYMLMGSYITARSLAIAQSRALVQSGNMGVAYGFLETTMSLAIVLGPPLAGYLYELQAEWMYIVGLALIFIGVCASLMFSPVRRADVQAFEEKERAEWMQS
jgi:MFS family permease